MFDFVIITSKVTHMVDCDLLTVYHFLHKRYIYKN